MRWWQGASLDEVSAGPARVALARPCRTPRERPKPSQRDDPLPTAQACAVAASTLPAGAQTRKSVKFEGEERWGWQGSRSIAFIIPGMAHLNNRIVERRRRLDLAAGRHVGGLEVFGEALLEPGVLSDLLDRDAPHRIHHKHS